MPRWRSEKWPGIHCLRMRERVRSWTSYTWLLCGEIDILLAVWQLCLCGDIRGIETDVLRSYTLEYGEKINGS